MVPVDNVSLPFPIRKNVSAIDLPFSRRTRTVLERSNFFDPDFARIMVAPVTFLLSKVGTMRLRWIITTAGTPLAMQMWKFDVGWIFLFCPSLFLIFNIFPGQIQENNYRPCIDTTEPNNITFGALLDSCCVVATYKDESDKIQSFSGCETKINCKISNSNMCRRCCDDQTSFLMESKPTCNLTPEKFTHQCYRCSGCLLISDRILANQTQCMAPPGEKRLCYTFRNATQLYRGCYYSKVHKVNKNLLACHQDPKSCLICEGQLCNNADAISLCYQCHFWNANCRFDQRLVGNLQTCGNFTFVGNNRKAGVARPTCYTMTR